MSASLPTTQRALFLPGPNNSPFEVGERTVPKPAAGQVLIKQHAVALNPFEWKLRMYGIILQEGDYPAVLGVDGAGEVVAVGEGVQNLNLKIGDRV